MVPLEPTAPLATFLIPSAVARRGHIDRCAVRHAIAADFNVVPTDADIYRFQLLKAGHVRSSLAQLR